MLPPIYACFVNLKRNMGLCTTNKLLCVFLLFVLLVLLYYTFGKSERMTNTVYLDQIVYDHPDPLLMKYMGREKDITGMSARDYYYENDIDARNLVGPQYLEGDSNYVDHSDYLDMPLEYRPAPSAGHDLNSAVSVPARSPEQMPDLRPSKPARKRDIVPAVTKRKATTMSDPMKSASTGAMQMAVKA